MSFTFNRLDPDDIDTYMQVSQLTFGSSPGSLTPCLWPNGVTPEGQIFVRQTHQAPLANPDTHYLLIRDPDNTLVGIAKWEFQYQDVPIEDLLEKEAQVVKKRENQGPVEGLNFAAWNDFVDCTLADRREIMQGKKHLYLSVLAVHPNHQRRGVGKAALDWGLKQADDLGLPAYLESTQEGRGLYEKYGFMAVQPFSFDLKKHNHPRDPVPTHFCMIRNPITLK